MTKSATATFAFVPVNLQTSATGITCQSPVMVNTASSCTVNVMDTSGTAPITPTGSFNLTSSNTGSFSVPCSLSESEPGIASCTVIYTPMLAGIHTIQADYPGDTSHTPSSDNVGITVTDPTMTTVSCDIEVLANQASTCTAIVIDTSTGPIPPTGTVSFASSGSATGSLSSNTCSLSSSAADRASCQVTFLPSTAGTADIAADYNGDSTHADSSAAAFSINVNKRIASTTVTCDSPVTVNTPSSCNVTVTDLSNGIAGTPVTPTGSFPLTSLGPATGTFNGPCNLSGSGASATCIVVFTPSEVINGGGNIIRASYPGDASHSSSYGSSEIIVAPAPLSAFLGLPLVVIAVIVFVALALVNIVVRLKFGFWIFKGRRYR